MAINPPPRKSDRSEPNPLVLLGAAGELGLVVAVLTLGGWWLDSEFDTLPMFTLIGAAVGLVGGLYNLYRISKRFF